MAEEDAKDLGSSEEIPQADDALDAAADEAGYVSNAADADEESAAPDDADHVDAPEGQELGDEDLPTPEPFEVDDPEAEELVESEPGESDDSDDDVEIDDPEQLEQAEEDAAAATSTKPVAKGRPVKKKTAEDVEDSDDGEVDTEESTPSTQSSTSSAKVPAKKNRPTRTRAEAQFQDAPKRTTIGAFVGQVVQELKKVVWPSGPQLRQYFIVVLVFVLFMIAFIGLLDVLFGWLTLKWFG